MAKSKAKAKSKPENKAKVQVQSVPEVPEVMQTNEFHLPLEDNSPGAIRSNDRIMKIALLILVLVVIGVAVIILTHNDPLASS